MTWKKSGELVLHPHNLEELASLFTYGRSQRATSLSYLTVHKQVSSGGKQLAQLPCSCTPHREVWKSAEHLSKTTFNPPSSNPSSTVFKGVCDKLTTTEATGVVCDTMCASHMERLRDKQTYLDLVIRSSYSSPPVYCTSSWCWTRFPECILQWTQKPVLSDHERQVIALTGLMENQSKWLLCSSHQPSGMTRKSPFSMKKQKWRSFAIILYKFKTH